MEASPVPQFFENRTINQSNINLAKIDNLCLEIFSFQRIRDLLIH